MRQQASHIKEVRRAIPKLRRRMAVGGSVQHAQQVGVEVQSEAAKYRAMLQGVRDHTYAMYAHMFERWFGARPPHERPVRDHYQTASARWMGIGGWALVVFESLLGAWLSRLFLTLPGAIASIAGLAVAFLLSYAAKGVITVVLGRYSETPIEVRDRLTRSLVVLGLAEAVLLVVFFYLRSSTDGFAVRIISSFGFVSALLSFVTPTLAGALFVGAILYEWSDRMSRDWDDAIALERELDSVGDVAGRHAPQPVLSPSHSNGNGVASTAPANPVLKAIVGWTMAVIIFSAASATIAVAQQPDCLGWPDGSKSVATSQLDAASREAVRVILAYGERLCPEGRWGVVPFGSDAWSALPAAVITLPARIECPPVKLSEAEALFTNARDRRFEAARASCDSLHAVHAERIRLAEAEARDSLLVAFRMAPAHRGNCTAIGDLLVRAQAAPSGTWIALTDGVESCRKGGELPKVDAPRSGVRLIMVLVYSTKQVREQQADFDERGSRILAAAPWVTVVPVWDLDRALRDLVVGGSTRPDSHRIAARSKERR